MAYNYSPTKHQSDKLKTKTISLIENIEELIEKGNYKDAVKVMVDVSENLSKIVSEGYNIDFSIETREKLVSYYRMLYDKNESLVDEDLTGALCNFCSRLYSESRSHSDGYHRLYYSDLEGMMNFMIRFGELRGELKSLIENFSNQANKEKREKTINEARLKCEELERFFRDNSHNLSVPSVYLKSLYRKTEDIARFYKAKASIR